MPVTPKPLHEMTDEEYDAHIEVRDAVDRAEWLAQYTDGFHVNTYEVDRAYGGPEEGGWWFDCGTVEVTTRCATLAEAEALADARRDEYPANGSSSSVVYDGGDYCTMIEPTTAANYPTERPYYC